MTRKPFSKLLDWFYLHCADNHAALQTKKGMIDVAVWPMSYVLGDSLSSTESTDAMRKQFYENLITVHKCTGANAVFHSAKYIGPILRQRRNLKEDPDFTVKELYRRHNFAERNIHRGGKRKAVKVKDGPIPPSSPSNDTTESTHPSSSNDALEVLDHAHVDKGIGSFSESLNWFYAHCAGHRETLGTHSSMLRIASWAMQEVNGVFLQENAKKTSAISFPRMLYNRHKCMGSYQFLLNFTRPICTRILELQDDVGFTQEELSRRHEFAQRSIAVMTRSSPTSGLAPTNSGLPNLSSAVASPSTQTVNTTVTTPTIRNSLKQDIPQS